MHNDNSSDDYHLRGTVKGAITTVPQSLNWMNEHVDLSEGIMNNATFSPEFLQLLGTVPSI